jgi:DNA-binding MarR family transcriptional regulator
MNEKSASSTPPELKALGCTNLRLRQMMRRVAQHYDQEMAQVGLKTTQYSLLTYVLKLGPLRPGELARGLKLSASTLTRNLRPLIDAGWLSLEPGTDARSRTVKITAEGRVKREEARHRWKAAQDSLNALLGSERVIALHALINDSLELLSTLPTEAGTDDE